MIIKSAKANEQSGYNVELSPNWLERLFNVKPITIRFIPDGRTIMGYTKYINCHTGERETYEELDDFIRKEKYKPNL